MQQHVRQQRDHVHGEREALGRVDHQQVEQRRELRQQRYHVLVRDRVRAALEQERVHARERRRAQLDGQLVHLVPGIGPVQRQSTEHARQQPGREQELVLVVGLEQRHGQPKQLPEHGELVVLRGRVAEQLEVLLRGVAVGLATAVVLGVGRRGLRVRHRPPRVMRHGVAGAPEVRRLVEARRRGPTVDRRPLRDRPLATTTALDDRTRVLVVQIRGRLENVPGHVQRPEVRFQRVHGRLQGQQQLRHIALDERLYICT